jgi:hypothetical protein
VKTLVPMLTINTLTKALKAIVMATENEELTPVAKVGIVHVIASGTLRDTADEIETIKREAS